MDIQAIHSSQKEFFNNHHNVDVTTRVEGLQKLRQVLLDREDSVYEALRSDLSKSRYESFLTEYQVVLSELKKFIYNTKSWSKPQNVRPSIFNFPSTARRYPEAYGNVLIISPWNYPFQLALAPLIGAVAAGNTVILKPSEFSPATSSLLKELIDTAFQPEHVKVVLGDAAVAQELTALKWDYIFFTGSPGVGKKIYQAAAQHLTPVTLELGGKNPCVVHPSTNLSVAARRIVWGKFLNAGQTCIAPDYLLVHEDIKDDFVSALQEHIHKAFGPDPKLSTDYPRIIRKAHFEKLIEMLEGERCIGECQFDKEALYIAPTLVEAPDRSSNIMKEEIFGPLLPVISYRNKKDIESWIDSYEKPLGAYCFSGDTEFENWFLNRFSFGGGAINDSIVQFVNDRLPFGGVGNSGIGSYHGKKSFDTFTHYKGVVHRGTWLDLPVRYAPYNDKFSKLRKILTWI